MITVISDWGNKDYYSAIFKAHIYARFPKEDIVDITHNIPAFDVESGVFNLKAIFMTFPENTINVLSVNQSNKPSSIILASYNHRYLIT